MIFENLINYDNIRLIKETDINQSQISLLPWIGNFTQSFLHTPKLKYFAFYYVSNYLEIISQIKLVNSLGFSIFNPDISLA